MYRMASHFLSGQLVVFFTEWCDCKHPPLGVIPPECLFISNTVAEWFSDVTAAVTKQLTNQLWDDRGDVTYYAVHWRRLHLLHVCHFRDAGDLSGSASLPANQLPRVSTQKPGAVRGKKDP